MIEITDSILYNSLLVAGYGAFGETKCNTINTKGIYLDYHTLVLHHT